MTYRPSANLSDETGDALRAYAEKHNLTVTQALTRGIHLLGWIDAESEAGRRIMSESADRETRSQLIMLV